MKATREGDCCVLIDVLLRKGRESVKLFVLIEAVQMPMLEYSKKEIAALARRLPNPMRPWKERAATVRNGQAHPRLGNAKCSSMSAKKRSDPNG